MLARYYDSMLKSYGDSIDPFKAIFDESYFTPRTYRESSDYRIDTDDSGLTLSVDLPGVKPEDLSCKVVDREIRVTGKCRGKDFKYYYTVSKAYDASEPEAELENGVLALRFKKKESEAREVKILVK